MNQKDIRKNLHDYVKTITEFSYPGYRIISGGGCKAEVTCKTIIG